MSRDLQPHIVHHHVGVGQSRSAVDRDHGQRVPLLFPIGLVSQIDVSRMNHASCMRRLLRQKRRCGPKECGKNTRFEQRDGLAGTEEWLENSTASFCRAAASIMSVAFE